LIPLSTGTEIKARLTLLKSLEFIDGSIVAKRNLINMRIVATGASSGIGYALVGRMLQAGAHVLATARREERLQQLIREHQDAPGTLSVLPGDLTLATHRENIAQWCLQNWGGLDTLVNNAGAGAIGPFADASSDRLRRVMEIDFFAPAELTRVCLPLLLRGNRPAILNIGSVLGHRAVPFKSEYCAAKFAMRGWSEAIRVELKRSGIDVLMVSPSTTRSEFFDSLLDTPTGTQSRSVGIMEPDAVAKIAIASLVRSKRERILSLGGKLLVWSGRWFPALTDYILGRSLAKT
jgi:short-subunit dehydrogenase